MRITGESSIGTPVERFDEFSLCVAMRRRPGIGPLLRLPIRFPALPEVALTLLQRHEWATNKQRFDPPKFGRMQV